MTPELGKRCEFRNEWARGTRDPDFFLAAWPSTRSQCTMVATVVSPGVR